MYKHGVGHYIGITFFPLLGFLIYCWDLTLDPIYEYPAITIIVLNYLWCAYGCITKQFFTDGEQTPHGILFNMVQFDLFPIFIIAHCWRSWGESPVVGITLLVSVVLCIYLVEQKAKKTWHLDFKKKGRRKKKTGMSTFWLYTSAVIVVVPAFMFGGGTGPAGYNYSKQMFEFWNEHLGVEGTKRLWSTVMLPLMFLWLGGLHYIMTKGLRKTIHERDGSDVKD